ncbi:S41 family peptidase [Planctomycetota bacterium]
MLPENIGYLRVGPWMSHEPAFQQALQKGMQELRHTRGLIIDVRGNGGGSRAPLRTIFPYFLDPNAAPQVLNVGAYRLGHRQDILDTRWMYRADAPGWSTSESHAIDKHRETFTPEWTLPEGKFSDWHYFVLGPTEDPSTYYYQQPVVILMNTTNFSATDIFLGAFKGQPNVTLMGTASGGGSGRRQSWRLRYSSVRIDLSSMASFQRNGLLYDGRGIPPDIVIEPEATFYIGQSDDTLKAAMDFLKGL